MLLLRLEAAQAKSLLGTVAPELQQWEVTVTVTAQLLQLHALPLALQLLSRRSGLGLATRPPALAALLALTEVPTE